MRPIRPSARLAAAAGAILVAACGRDLNTLEPATFPTQGEIFTDAFAAGVGFQGFSGSKTDALSSDVSSHRVGTTALKVLVPNPGDPAGGYSGGAFVADVPRDLSGYNALTFWAKASISAKLDVAGIGNDNTGTSKFTAQRSAIPLTPVWTKYTIPLPDASKLAKEKGMFYFAEGPENGVGYTIWFDDIKFETVSSIQTPRPVIPTLTSTEEVGATKTITGTTVTYSIDGVDQTFDVAPNYFTFVSSNPSVAAVSATGTITVVGAGTAKITAKLGNTAAAGTVTLNTVAAPTAAAPTPTRAAADVISLFSNAYTNVPVDTWSASFDQADVADVTIAGNAAKRYSNLGFAGVEFISRQINATTATILHLDVFTYDAGSFRVKLVDFGANGAFGGGDDSEFEVPLSGTSTPKLTAGAWSSLDIPLSAFTGLQSKAHLAQLIFSASSPTLYLDNVYFYKAPAPPPPPGPTTAAPAPTATAANVISLFSNAYTNRVVDTWSADWDNADVSDLKVAGDDVKKYSNLAFAGIEFTSQQIDASTMTTFHMDLWTPDSTKAPAIFKIKLVDFGADGAFGGGNDVEHEITINRANTPAFVSGSWISLDIPLTTFAGLTTKAHLAQLIISGDLPTVFIDNVYFYKPGGAATAPTTAAPTPTFTAANVISLFSNAYTNQQVDTWSADWDSADLTDLKVAGDDVKKYSNLVFAGIEFTTKPVDATTMTAFHVDLWTPDAITPTTAFRIKLVDFGADGKFAGGDDVEHEITLSATSTPSLASGSWLSLEIPLSRFAGLTTKGHLAQLIISGDLKTVFVDNVLLHK